MCSSHKWDLIVPSKGVLPLSHQLMCKDAPLAVMLNACISRLKPNNVCWSLGIGQIPKSRSFVTYSLPYLLVPKMYFHHFCWLAAWYVTHFRVSVQTKASCCLWYLKKTTSINFPNTATISLVNICHCHTLCPHDICFITKSLYLYLFCSSYYPQTLVTTTLFSLYMS